MTDRSNLKISPVEFSILDTFVVKGLKVSILEFEVPLNYYDSKDTKTIKVVCKYATKFDSSKHLKVFDLQEDIESNKENVVVYLQGGPGHQSSFPISYSGISYQEYMVNKGYAFLHLDQRGTGLSSAIDADSLVAVGSPEEQLQYLLNFRADSIIYDCETIRKSLFKKDQETKWSIMGQSYGGFCSITYASFFPNSLKRAFTAGGIPPLGLTADDVYNATHKRTRERNISYYKRFPQDVERVKYIADYLVANDVKFPNGGKFSLNRFKQFGLRFGMIGGSDSLHAFIITLSDELKKRGTFTYASLLEAQNYLSFETNILYALFQENIYCDGKGKTSKWAAYRTMPEDFKDDSQIVYFTGEMVFPFIYDDYSELAKVKDVAYLLQEYDNYTNIYDLEALKKLKFEQVPIVAASYYADQYVDFELSKHAKETYLSDCCRQYVTSEFFHDGVRSNTTKILDQLFDLLDNEII